MPNHTPKPVKKRPQPEAFPAGRGDRDQYTFPYPARWWRPGLNFPVPGDDGLLPKSKTRGFQERLYPRWVLLGCSLYP